MQLFDATVILKYRKGPCEQNIRVRLSKYYHHAKSVYHL